MKKVELHVKTKYSIDKDSTIDIETILWNAKENGENGIVFVDKDTIISFPKIQKIYTKLCDIDKSFNEFKIGFGVELTCIINNSEQEVVMLVKNTHGLKHLYSIVSMYLNKYNKKIPLSEILKYKEYLLIGLILNKNNIHFDLSMFDYLEFNNTFPLSDIDNKYINNVVYSNIPNALFEEELKAKEVLYFYQKIDKNPECRLYLDTESTLKEFNNKKIVINNSNNLLDKLDDILIIDQKFHINQIDNFKEFENMIRNNFSKKYKNPSPKTINRLNEELKLIKDLDYTYVYILLMIITKFCKKEKEYYQLNGYINNSIVAYILELTEIEPYDLPYELFFSEIPKIEFVISPDFYNTKMLMFMIEKFEDQLIKCNKYLTLNKKTILRIIKNYEIMKKEELNSSIKDYICSVLEDIPLYRETPSHSFYIFPKDKDIFDFTPYEISTSIAEKNMKKTHFDSRDLSNNLIKLSFRLNNNIKNITNLINKTNNKIEFCNDKRIFNLFRNTEEFGCKFNILNRSNGTLNIYFFNDKELENKLVNIPNIWLEDLVEILINTNHGIIEDDLYSNLKIRNLDDVNIFNVINYLKESKKLLISKSVILNTVRLAYMQMYYKLYYPIDYYKEMLSNIDYDYIDEKIYNGSICDIKKNYYNLIEKNQLHLNVHESEELRLLEILLEMFERNIKYNITNKEIIITEE